MNEFEKLGLGKRLVDILVSMGFESPTEIQKGTIPAVLEGRDIIGIASTGSGKTLAFSSGIIEHSVPGRGIQALVLTPTRELAEQIAKVMRGFSSKSGLNIVEVFGGVDIQRQIVDLREADIVVGTPGRILDHLRRGSLDLSEIKTLVLDEADRMADMGFMKDVETIINQCPKERQTLLFSATTSPDVDVLERKYMREAVNVSIEKYVDPSKLKQVYYNAQSYIKFSLLVHLLKNERSEIIMIFCNTRRTVDLLTVNLNRFGIPAKAIHGGLEQRKRSKVIDKLHNKEAMILVCTDVAARGLDIKNVTHVYNYDIPRTSEEYVHRIGRTARAGEEGMAISLVSNNDYENFARVLMDDSIKVQEMEAPQVETLHPDFKSDARRRGTGRPSFREGGRGRDSGRRESRGFSGRPRREGEGSFGGRRGSDSGRGSRSGSSRGDSRGGDRGRRSFGGRRGSDSGRGSRSGGSRGFSGRRSVRN